MTEKFSQFARRSFLSGIGTVAAGIGVTVAAAPPAAAQSGGFRPRRHVEDMWLNAPRSEHRIIIDSSTPEGAGSALLYAANTFAGNKTGYKLEAPDLAVIVLFRHLSTPFGYSDKMWAQYGGAFSEILNFKDPKTQAAPTANLYNSADYGVSLSNFGSTIPSLAEKSVQFVVCDMATRFMASAVAEKTKGDTEAIYRELAANLIPNSHMTAAGIVTVNRAQEYGYTLLTAV